MDSGLAPTSAPARRLDRFVPGLFLLALALRVGALFLLDPFKTLGDELYNMQMAHRAMVGGPGLSRFPLLWPHLMAVPLLLVQSPVAPRLLAATLGAGAVALTARLASRVMEARSARLAGLFFAFYPEHVLFSHYLYPDVAAGFFGVAGLAVLFDAWPNRPRRRDTAVGFGLIGLAALCQPLAAVTAVAAAVALRPRRGERDRGWFALAPSAFFLPLAAYVAWAALMTGDPLSLAGHGPSNPAVVRVSPGEPPTVRRTAVNLANLWTPNSYASERLRIRYYGAGTSDGAGDLIAVAHVALVGLAIVGLVVAPPGAFRTCGWLCLAELSALSVTPIMVSHYRISQLQVLMVFAGFAAANPGYVWPTLSHGRRLAAAAVLLTALAAVCATRWSTIGTWP